MNHKNFLGMLWWDGNPNTTLATKVLQAAAYYAKKYEQIPNVCFIHPSMSGSDQQPVDQIEIRTTNGVLPNHFWIGVSEGNI